MTLLPPKVPRICDCGCGKSFIPPSTAPHKRFASDKCRDAFWASRRREAMKMLEESSGESSP